MGMSPDCGTSNGRFARDIESRHQILAYHGVHLQAPTFAVFPLLVVDDHGDDYSGSNIVITTTIMNNYHNKHLIITIIALHIIIILDSTSYICRHNDDSSQIMTIS